jgi:hypothetical protein
MRRAILVGVTSIAIGAMMASFAIAQRPHEVAMLDHFLMTHPEVAKRLAADPKLADDPEFLAKHPGLKNLLITHPDTKALIPSASQRYAAEPPDAAKTDGSPTR